MNIYVAGLNYNIRDIDLNDIFAEFGEVVSAKVINDRETGKSRGFGFVEMPNEEEGRQAIEKLNDFEIGGKRISVSEARPREDRSQSRDGGNRNGGGYNRPRRY